MKNTKYAVVSLISILLSSITGCANNLSNLPDLPQLTVLPQVSELQPLTELPQMLTTLQETDFQNVDLPPLTLPQAPRSSQVVEPTQPRAVSLQSTKPPALPRTPPAIRLVNTRITTDESEPGNHNDTPLDDIANDLVKALSFIPSMGPSLVSIRTSTPGTEFDNIVKNSMQRNGYSFDRNGYSFDRGINRSSRKHLTTSFVQSTMVDRNSTELTAIMAINSILIKRTYLIQSGTLQPVTSYIAHGIDPMLVSPSNQISVL